MDSENKKANKKVRVGVVVSDKMQKTVIVEYKRLVPHPIYKKRIRRTKRFVAHDEREIAKVGDVVKIEETRPLSKTKKWRVIKVLQKGKR